MFWKLGNSEKSAPNPRQDDDDYFSDEDEVVEKETMEKKIRLIDRIGPKLREGNLEIFSVYLTNLFKPFF